ncbi:MAG: hypothetical protein AAGG11_04660 [Pseudomonadota bacterium]
MRRTRQSPQDRRATVNALCGELVALLDEPVSGPEAVPSSELILTRPSEL